MLMMLGNIVCCYFHLDATTRKSGPRWGVSKLVGLGCVNGDSGALILGRRVRLIKATPLVWMEPPIPLSFGMGYEETERSQFRCCCPLLPLVCLSISSPLWCPWPWICHPVLEPAHYALNYKLKLICPTLMFQCWVFFSPARRKVTKTWNKLRFGGSQLFVVELCPSERNAFVVLLLQHLKIEPYL